MSRMFKETKMIMQFITEVGGMTIEQGKALLGEKANCLDYYIGCLNGYYIHETFKGSRIYTLVNSKKPYNKKNELCAWVMLDNEVNTNPEEKEYFRGEHPAQLFFLSGNSTYITMYVDENGLNSVRLMEEVYASRGDDTSTKVVFVVDSDAAREMVMDANLSIPYGIAYVHQEGHNCPEIDYDIAYEKENEEETV